MKRVRREGITKIRKPMKDFRIFGTHGRIRTSGLPLRSSNQAVSVEFLQSLPKTRKA